MKKIWIALLLTCFSFLVAEETLFDPPSAKSSKDTVIDERQNYF